MTTIEQQAEKLHWIKIGDDGIPELYLDNHMMQTFRMCEARFISDFVEGIQSPGRVWFLDLGTCVHKMIELYYLNRDKPSFSTHDWAINIGSEIWMAKDMDFYVAHPIWSGDYQKLNGRVGFCTLLLQYANHFSLENERLRVVGTELYFGKGKEVPLHDPSVDPRIICKVGYYAPFRLYLSGKIDLLIDDGNSIGPMDHKTSKDFRGRSPLTGYEIHDGMTGYLYAARELTRKFPELERRQANKIWMNFLQIKEEKITQDRFKRLPLFKTDEQLEDYRLRMIRTASKIFQLLTTDATPDFNTGACTNWMHGVCPLHEIHRQGSKDAMEQLISMKFQRRQIWNPETIDAEDEAVLQIVKATTL